MTIGRNLGMASRKVTISLDEDVLARVERGRAATGMSRSEYIGRAVTTFLAQERARRLLEHDRRGYTAHPETSEWAEAADRLAEESWAGLPWEE
jgi:metal-responsive CopG/Arc/MetJ family transcriptional regulator